MRVKKLLIATGNRHKTEEIRAMLGAGWIVEDLKDHPHLPQPEETGATFAENAAIKAVTASRALPGVLVLSDDSGLEVDVLGGAPGVTSARYAGAGASDADNRAKLKGELRRREESGVEEPFAGRFRCCMCLARDGAVLGTFDGAVEGKLLLQEEGSGGFGYDSLFLPDGFESSFGVLPLEVKNTLSHRARALAKVVNALGRDGFEGRDAVMHRRDELEQ
ncbi:MAG TPA: non-canonical purine NTP pyrophosphatase [Verrucomicrobiaceae bacterium]